MDGQLEAHLTAAAPQFTMMTPPLPTCIVSCTALFHCDACNGCCSRAFEKKYFRRGHLKLQELEMQQRGRYKKGEGEGTTEAKEHQREGERMENRRKKNGRSFVVVRFYCVQYKCSCSMT